MSSPPACDLYTKKERLYTFKENTAMAQIKAHYINNQLQVPMSTGHQVDVQIL